MLRDSAAHFGVPLLENILSFNVGVTKLFERNESVAICIHLIKERSDDSAVIFFVLRFEI